jgi:hypothetical protein
MAEAVHPMLDVQDDIGLFEAPGLHTLAGVKVGKAMRQCNTGR